MDIEQKLAVGKEKKATGDECFRSGDYKGGGAYHEVIGDESVRTVLDEALTGGGVPDPDNKPGSPQAKTEADELLEKIWTNMAACHLKGGNYKRVIELADKALKKAKAYAAQGYTEKAIDILEELLKQDPNDVLMKKDLEDIKIKQAATEKKGLAKFKGKRMYNRPSKEEKSGDDGEKVEEVKSPGVAASSVKTLCMCGERDWDTTDATDH
ncbi:TPR_2 domain-containing protein [Rhizoctonia solani AG-1 IA]|uniref:TPR_2 domain-containing protein n=1 Tax=Thanatephorus cucumeris (strain AG1-IA) TaxID=983506 RepID=L8WWF8_THACA|nr:TPR_2 domain-containing protein [Rhizoctonia solani AG-1 IA]